MILIIQDLILKNIHKLTKDHLREAAKKYNLSYTEDELEIIFCFINEHYQDLLNQDISCFNTIRSQINPELYKQLLCIYIELKQKYL